MATENTEPSNPFDLLTIGGCDLERADNALSLVSDQMHEGITGQISQTALDGHFHQLWNTLDIVRDHFRVSRDRLDTVERGLLGAGLHRHFGKEAQPALPDIAPDQHIFDALDTVRREKAIHYSFDTAGDNLQPDDEYEAADQRMMAAEGVIDGVMPRTVQGVAAKLILTLTRLDPDRHLDAVIARSGFEAAYALRDNLISPEAQGVADCIHALLAIAGPIPSKLAHDPAVTTEWDQRLAAYREAAAEHEVACTAYSRAETAALDAEEGSSEHTACKEAEEAEGRASEASDQALDRLLRTPAPNHEALAEKVRIAAKEGRLEDAAGSIRNDILTLSQRSATEAEHA